MVKKTIRKFKRKTARIIVKNRVYKKCRLTLAREKARRKRMSCFILTLAFVLGIIPGYMFLHHKINKNRNTAEITQTQEIYSIGHIVYRHLKAYPNYCRKVGYKMVTYPKVFLTAYEHEIFGWGMKARQKGLNPDKMMQKIQGDFAAIVQKSITKEFNQLRKRGIGQQEGKQFTEESEICRYLDENASVWLQTEKKADIERLQRFINPSAKH